MKNINYFLLLLVITAGCANQQSYEEIQLNSGWEFTNSNEEKWYPAKVPGVVQLDLLTHKLIPDPFVGTKEEKIQWVENEDWIYRTSFNIEKEQLKMDHIELEFEGLDTYAKVLLNDVEIIKANNMFLGYKADIKSNIKEGENLLEVHFSSPIKINKEKVLSSPYQLPAGSETVEVQVSPYTRKAAYQFGWDFAPRIVTMGIWKPVNLNLWNGVQIKDIQFLATQIDSSIAKYDVIIEIHSDVDEVLELRLFDNIERIDLKRGINQFSTSFEIENPKLWWPNGHGEANLYDIPVEIWRGNTKLTGKTEKLGVRTIELIQEKDKIGESYYFLINGKNIFMQGANWSPISSYPSSIPDSVYQNRLESAKEANMNMLRVWGGGIYESDQFYNLCDEYGILVWQDFMFANSMYPNDSQFLKNTESEVEYQIKRLRNHASLAVWNGNNEIDVAWHNWGWQDQFGYSKEDSIEIWNNYNYMFKELIPEKLTKFDPTRQYTSTSPLSNWGKKENFTTGSMHYWGVWHGKDDFNDYQENVGRFMAEYGFQSYPDASTIRSYYGKSVILPDSNNLLHQKSYVGNGLILEQASRYYDLSLDIDEFANASQLIQAIGLKMAIEAHKLNMNKCGGTLFWQMNDCWPGPSWSIIDYFGNKKLAYEVVKDRYKPIILITSVEESRFEISVSNTSFEELAGILKIEMLNNTGERSWVFEKEVKIKANNVTSTYVSHLSKLLDGTSPDEAMLKMTLTVGELVQDIENFYFVDPKEYKGAYDIIGLQ